MTRRDNECGRGGFSIVELVVVVAIVAVMMALLLPSLKQARAEGRRVVCLSNLRQQGIALGSYTNAYGGSWPVVGGVYADWMLAVAPYLGWTQAPAWDPMTRPTVYKKLPVFICPEWQSYLALPSGLAGDCYGRNMFLMGGDMTKFTHRNDTPSNYASWSADWAHRRTVHSVKSAPSRIVLHFDAHLYEVSGWGTLTSQALNRGHFGRANLAFVDGHVENLARMERTDLWMRDGSMAGWF